MFGFASVHPRITVKLTFHPAGYSGGDVMDDCLGLRLYEAEPKSTSGTTGLLRTEIGGFFLFPGSPNVSHNAGELAENNLPVDLVFYFLFPGGKIHRLG